MYSYKNPFTNNALYDVEVTPTMEIFFNLPKTGYKRKLRQTERNLSAYNSHCKWLKARDVMCNWLLQIMDLPGDVGRLQYGAWGRRYWFTECMFM